jgi:hypothetical protein
MKKLLKTLWFRLTKNVYFVSYEVRREGDNNNLWLCQINVSLYRWEDKVQIFPNVLNDVTRKFSEENNIPIKEIKLYIRSINRL